MIRTELAGVELAQEYEEGVPFLPELGGYLVRETPRHHVEHSPTHTTELLPRYLVLSLIDQSCRVFILLLLSYLLPVGQKILVQDFLAVVEPVLYKMDRAEDIYKRCCCYDESNGGCGFKGPFCFDLDVIHVLICWLLVDVEMSVCLLQRLGHLVCDRFIFPIYERRGL